MKTRKENEVLLAASNPLLGCGVFVFLNVPDSWMVLKSPEPPECNALGKEIAEGGFRWITSGFIRVLIINKAKNQAYPLFVEAKEFRNDLQPLEFIKEKFQKLDKNGKVVERKQLRVNGHEAQYAMWLSRKKMFLRREKVILAHVECLTYCNFTRRLLLFRISSSHVENFMEDLEKILSILSSVTCHI